MSMHVQGALELFHDDTAYLHYSKTLTKNEKEVGKVECLLYFGSTHMLDYQKDIFLDALTDIVDMLETTTTTLDEMKEVFETCLQQINAKLSAFAEKSQQAGFMQIKGLFQIFRGSAYMSSLIGETSVMILRGHQVHYRVAQSATDPAYRIDRFNEFLEGECKSDDQILALGIHIDTYIDKHDMQTVLEHATLYDRSVEDVLKELLITRTDHHTLAFISRWTLEEQPLISEYRLGREALKVWQRIGGRFHYFKHFQKATLYIVVGVAALVMLTWIIESFLDSTGQVYVAEEGGVVMNISIEDIQKDIASFKRIDPSSEMKIKKYNEIVAQLDLLEQSNKRTVDVKKLRGILEKDYLDGFNIESVLDLDESAQLVYTFSQQEKNTFGALLGMFWRNGLFVVGEEGVLLGGIDNDIRGTLVSVGVQRKVDACTPNLLKNGLYCVMQDGELFNIMRSGLQPLSTTDGRFDTDIIQLATFGSTNFYTLSQQVVGTGAKGSFSLVRYINQRGSQENFAGGTRYTIDSDDAFAQASADRSNVAVDGAFLLWSSISQSLWELWRPGIAPTLLYREIPLQGGDTLRAPGKESKVIAFADSRFVYLRDEGQQVFTVYRSSPYKTNDAHTTDYSLLYFFSIKFTLGDVKVRDVYVEEGEKAQLYLMTANEVRRIDLGGLRDKFFAKEQQTE